VKVVITPSIRLRMFETSTNWRRFFFRKRIVLICFFACVVCFGCLVSFGVGILIGEGNKYQHRYEEERLAVEPLISSSPAYRGIEIHRRSNGGIYLAGEICRSDLPAFKEGLTKVLGKTRAEEAFCCGVEVK
jgi:hypothetical protein